jgi:hypothetical protein
VPRRSPCDALGYVATKRIDTSDLEYASSEAAVRIELEDGIECGVLGGVMPGMVMNNA